MEKSEKTTGVFESLSQKHLRVKQVAGMMDITVQIVYKAMREGRLKYTKVMTANRHQKASGFLTVTTKEWVDQWRATINDKDFQRWNGKPMYDPSKGEMSTSQARKLLGWTKNKFAYYLANGHIKYINKGYYYVLDRADVLAFKEKFEQQQLEKQA